MRLLLDTHSLIWFFTGSSNLSDTGRILMENPTHQKLISLASVWEMAIKQSKGKLTLTLPLEPYIEEKIKLEDFATLPIKLKHLSLVSNLPFHHNDPFDRLLIAQAITEKIPILSRDSIFDQYNVNRIWN
ncbi:MAG: type II toxin-antitoxin system VapC family toxin [Okeania sp. SIO2C9]|uniref:type II toxin-antitoxin system VapC family toxin n=1 Tax=Okeania sp. SIO2C9 TaxID=2607791 RepID=UPI0013C20E9D|nr:type II toxin-antitoxin system VapC family toxin [Okeania sp. SIO2C9]NEQ74409.1 type II toxin-antitoxin system VapC family toxin [Okeania sp. SIO2C9]